MSCLKDKDKIRILCYNDFMILSKLYDIFYSLFSEITFLVNISCKAWVLIKFLRSLSLLPKKKDRGLFVFANTEWNEDRKVEN